MADNATPLLLPRDSAESIIKSLSQDSANIVIEPHFSARMIERGITMAQVLDALLNGHLDRGPVRDDYGDWRCRMRKRSAGARINVVCAISGGLTTLYLVTTY